MLNFCNYIMNEFNLNSMYYENGTTVHESLTFSIVLWIIFSYNSLFYENETTANHMIIFRFIKWSYVTPRFWVCCSSGDVSKWWYSNYWQVFEGFFTYRTCWWNKVSIFCIHIWRSISFNRLMTQKSWLSLKDDNADMRKIRVWILKYRDDRKNFKYTCRFHIYLIKVNVAFICFS